VATASSNDYRYAHFLEINMTDVTIYENGVDLQRNRHAR